VSKTGVLIRAVSSFYDVEADSGQILRCRARGHLRYDKSDPVPGDLVTYEIDSMHINSGILTGVLPRRNILVRPNVANVDQIIFIATAARPQTDPYLIDMASVAAEENHCRLVLCLNKADLDSADELYTVYQSCGVQVLRTSAVTGIGLDELRDLIQGKLSVLTGNSGVGKTSLLNRLLPGVFEKTGDISPKHGRGRHTTRRTELHSLPGGGWLADTPGFSAMEIGMISALEPCNLGSCFPEFPQGQCRFLDCLHFKEPECAVKQSLLEKKIFPSRYQSYLRMLEELKNIERSR